MIIFKLREIMEKKEIGQRELSRQTGIRQATISDYVNNKVKHINTDNLDVLCKYFKCEIGDIVEHIDSV